MEKFQLLPSDIESKLLELEYDFQQGDITEQGYKKRKSALLLSVKEDPVIAAGEGQTNFSNDSNSTSTDFAQASPNNRPVSHLSLEMPDYRFNPSTFDLQFDDNDLTYNRIHNTYTERARTEDYEEIDDDNTVAYQRKIFEGSPHKGILNILEPRDIPFSIFDPHNENIPLSKFDNLAAILRYRGQTIPKKPAFLVLDSKGKEVHTMTWEKIALRAEKVGHVIREKSGLYRGDRVALVYRDSEVVEFVVALLGCFIAGVVAVPVNKPEDYEELNFILTSTQAHLALTTDNNLKAFQRGLSAAKIPWPRGVEWWKTNDFGSFHPKKKEELPALQAPELAYIEFSRSPTGELRGVVISHRTILHAMSSLLAVIFSVPGQKQDSPAEHMRDKHENPVIGTGSGEVLVTYLDPRQSVGILFSVLMTVYGGYTTVWTKPGAVATPGLFANIVTRYKASLVLADYPGLKTVAYNYQNDPLTTRNFSKKHPVDFSSVRLCFIDCQNVDPEFHEILADRYFKPLGNHRAWDIVAPMLCLPEHGGMVITVRDWLGGQDRMMPDGPALLDEGDGLTDVLLNKEALKTNEVIVIATGAEAKTRTGEPGTVRIGAFGNPLADATLAVVDPEIGVICPPHMIGEIWVDSPSLSAGFWALPKHTSDIFHAKPLTRRPDGGTEIYRQEFLRTGFLGCTIEGKVFVLGMYEDRLRQKVEWVEDTQDIIEYRYHYTSHLVTTIMKNIKGVFDCGAFDTFVNEEHLPVIIIESPVASTTPITPSSPPKPLDVTLLSKLAERTIEILLDEHHVRVYCVLLTAPNTLPRVFKNGRKEIGNMLSRKEFEAGALPCVYIKFAVERAVLNLPIGEDPVGGVWSPEATYHRQESLAFEERQYSGVDQRDIVIDERTSLQLNTFESIVDLLQWRVSRQTEELSYCTIDSRGKEGKGTTWKKLDMKIAAVAHYLKTKANIFSGEHAVLMYTHSEDFVYAIHACFCLGITAIPIAPVDPNRLSEDVPALLSVIRDYSIKAILVNADIEHLIKGKAISQHLKQSVVAARLTLPPIYNTSKPPKQIKGCKELGMTIRHEWVLPSYPALIWAYWTPDQRRIAVQLGHDTILSLCKVQKETCQMVSSRPLLGCVRSTSGIGFLHTCLMGIYVGTSTYLVSPVDYAANPALLLNCMARYKTKDTYATPQMLDHAIQTTPVKGISLHEIKNLMISFEGRPRTNMFQLVRTHFSSAYLDYTAINTTYSHVLNPMIATRSYMCIEPIELYLSARALRRGVIEVTSPDEDRFGLLVHDSGMVPVSTQVAIVNPGTCCLCRVGEFGEIWVASDACAKSFYGSRDAFDLERFRGRLVDGDPRIIYVRTGDLGFLHNVSRPIGPGGAVVDMQTLFVLGSIGETFEVNGLNHFPVDIEHTIERSHKNIVGGGSAVFQAGGSVVVLVEVVKAEHLASLVPVIVNAILDEHQLIVDTVAFVALGEFPRSRLGEKQRGKILANWVSRRLYPVARYAVRELERSDNSGPESATDITPNQEDQKLFPEGYKAVPDGSEPFVQGLGIDAFIR
ncbi:hypothetical protein NEOLI_000288 [Neolecta irregularis DAH-3]|uniref:DMAP1-binding domain-containing protein n=1 Tax=Neolecta irregularis (strain DAH-3) TaxID=1198029 RepID=A0A1U7LV81_NEOID|nr:hypothetical protein NEOLI_000288 [Neolecta irregularis DAH-3]|eukprot:OLL26567.1 hypothetical protein NEOLI_000288 [Neolecta irregularis DAH-3]